MEILHKRKKTTALSIEVSLRKMETGERWCYGTGKLDNEEYHSVKNTVSTSQIKDFINPDKSDYYFYRHHIKRDIEREAKDIFDIGTSAHFAVLEPEKFKSEVVARPDSIKVRRGEKWDAFVAENQGKVILTQEQMNMVNNLAQVVFKNKYARALLKDTHSEVSGFYKHDTDLILRARADAISFAGSYAIDLKFMDDVSPRSFAKSAVNNGYYIQSEIYKKVFGVDDFIFICVSKREPHEIAIYILDDEYKERAILEIDEALPRLKSCIDANYWSSYTTPESSFTVLSPPSWFKFS